MSHRKTKCHISRRHLRNFTHAAGMLHVLERGTNSHKSPHSSMYASTLVMSHINESRHISMSHVISTPHLEERGQNPYNSPHSSMWCIKWVYSRLLRDFISAYEHPWVRGATGRRRPIGCLELQVNFRKRATNYRAFWRKITYKHKVPCGSSPPCNVWHQSLSCVA